MLGRLLNTAASTLSPSSYPRNTTQLESVTEEEHTSGLLFPDASLLRHTNELAYPLHTAFNSPNASNAGAFDDRGGLELDPVKDFRIIVAQNALGDRDPCILLDSNAPSTGSASQGLGINHQAFEPSGAKHSRAVSSITRGGLRGGMPQSSTAGPGPLSTAADARRSSISSGAFSRARGRSSTLSPTGGWHDSGLLRPSDSNDSGLLNCIFGSSAFSYRGSSTKMHIITADEELGRAASVNPAARSPLPRSYTTGSSSTPAVAARVPEAKPPSKVTVLLTRMFSVNLPADSKPPSEWDDYVSSVYQESLPEAGFPFPDVMRRRRANEKRTPVYAVAITIQVPLLSRNSGRVFSRLSPHPPGSPRTLAHSLDSDYRFRGGLFDDSLSLASPPASLDERIDLLVDHWDVITRALSRLERLARKEILFLLKKVDSLSGAHSKSAKPPNLQRNNQTIVYLPANILSVSSKLREEAARATRRISIAFQMPYVVTGQSRWGVWREEGRSIVRNLGGKEHSFFFHVLLTAFLGNHTEWLSMLGPEWHRRRHYQQMKAQLESEPVIQNRTVIVCADKMTARRLIFLLSAFLPAKQRFDTLPSPLRPVTSTSIRGVSQSPPNVPVLRQESLRRAIERRSRAQRMNLAESDQHHRSVSASSTETAHRLDDVDPALPSDSLPKRRGSDARSMKALSVPMHAMDSQTKNTSTATISRAIPGSTVPVPHFASRQTQSERERPDQAITESGNSLASVNLIRNLQRSESSTTSPNSNVSFPGSRWGNLLSGLWSSRQDSSTVGGGAARNGEHRKRSISTSTSSSLRRPTTLSQMAEETSTLMGHDVSRPPTSGSISIPHATNSRPDFEEQSQDSPSKDRMKESPLKMSVRAEDGVVDVDLPLPGFVSLSSSGDSTVASPKKPRTSVTSVDILGSTHSSSSGFHGPAKDNDGPHVNVAGWLKSFHEDFLLQAVRPYRELEADIRRAMQTEGTAGVAPSFYAEGGDKWVDTSMTLIADTRTFTVKRLRLRRKYAANADWTSLPPASSSSTHRAPGASPASLSATNSSGDRMDISYVEEQVVEEPVMDLDGTLVDAIERVLLQSGRSSSAQSRAPSPHRNRKRDDTSILESASRDDIPSLEVPRTECRKAVLGALEEVARSVAAEHSREYVAGERERKRVLIGPDNTLREGIRKWLLDIEESF